MIQHIDIRLQREFTMHTRRLGLKRIFQSMGYERSGELPLIASRLLPLFGKPIRLLDIGSGDSVFPSYILGNTDWDVTCLDKFSTVEKQPEYAQTILRGQPSEHRLHVVRSDLLSAHLAPESFDVITNISVIEHVPGADDAQVMHESAKLLKPGGICLLTTLINDGHAREFYVKSDVYGDRYNDQPIFFQRHYDVLSFEKRVLKPAGLIEKERLYFGDYGFQFFENFMDIPWPWKPIKILYQWATPLFSRRFLTYRDYPVSRVGMHMFTASGVFVYLQKAG
jgi:SAM-dependent methyltransferase